MLLLIAHTASGKSFSHLQAQPPGVTVSSTKRKKTDKHRYPQSGTGHSSFQHCPLSVVHINARTAPQVSASFPSSLNRLCPPAVSKSGAPCCCALRTGGGGGARVCIQVGGLFIGLLRSPLLFPKSSHSVPCSILVRNSSSWNVGRNSFSRYATALSFLKRGGGRATKDRSFRICIPSR